jgi:hypothetical protein
VSGTRILDRVSGISDTEIVRMSSRCVIAVLVLAIWVLLGPIAMAFSGCAVMGAMCEGPCGTTACAIAAPTMSGALGLLSSFEVTADRELPANIPAGLEHPPKSLLHSA